MTTSKTKASFLQNAIEDNIVQTNDEIRQRLASVEAKEGIDAGIAARGDRAGDDPNGISLIAGEYPSNGYIQWVADDLLTLVGLISGDHSIGTTPVSSGLRIIGQAKQSGEIGIVYLIANNDAGVAGGGFMSVRSNGEVYIGTDGAGAGTDKPVTLQVGTTATNTILEALTVSLNTTGTAAAGFGTGMGLWAENGSGTLRKLVTLFGKYRTVTDAAEEARLFAGLIQGGANNDYIVPLAKYVSGSLTTILTTETTIFDLTIPANWLSGDNIIRFKVYFRVVATTARTLTAKVYYDDTTMITGAGASTGTSSTFTGSYEGILQSTGSNTQIAFLETKNFRTDTAAFNAREESGTAAEDTATVKNIKLTLQLSGAVQSAVTYGITVEYVNGTQ